MRRVPAMQRSASGAKRQALTCLWLLLLLLCSGLCVAQSEAVAEEEPVGWQFELMPYAWLPGTFGTVEIKGRTATVDTTVGDVLTLLWHGDAFTLGGYFGARYDHWNFFADAYGGFLNEDVLEQIPTRFHRTLQVGAELKLGPMIADIAAGYQLAEWRIPEWRRPISVGIYLGTRIVHLGTELDTQVGVVGGIQGKGRSFSHNTTTASPMIGL